jgi:hypothetical protein
MWRRGRRGNSGKPTIREGGRALAD